MSFFGVSCFLSLGLKAQPQVSVSIPPLQLIAAAITDGISTPTLILGGGQDPHHPSLKPSQRQALADADLLLWVGPDLERALEKVVVGLDADVITALNLDGLHTHLLRGSVDPHIWLDTENARIIARELSRQLSRLDPGNAGHYQTNLADFELALFRLDESVEAVLAQQNKNAYAVYHNAFLYYEQQFGLQHAVSFTEDEELKPGIRRLLAIREELEQNNVNCLLVEPELNTAELDNIVNLSRYVTVDVLGSSLPVTKTGYIKLIHSLTDAMLECLR